MNYYIVVTHHAIGYAQTIIGSGHSESAALESAYGTCTAGTLSTDQVIGFDSIETCLEAYPQHRAEVLCEV